MKIQLCILAVLAFVSFGAIPVLAGQDAYYTCPMHSEIHGHKEGECPICSMELVTADSTNHMMIHDGSKNKMSAEKTDNSIALHVPDIIKLEKGKLVTLKVQLTKIQNNQPISINQLNEVHTQRFHALIIDPSIMVPADKEMVEDLVKAAHADARRKLDDAMGEAMKNATGGLGGMLPGFKLPF